MRVAESGAILSKQELAVLRYLSYGKEAPWIAQRLGIKESTVRTYVSRAEKKLKAKNRAHAITIAIQRQMI